MSQNLSVIAEKINGIVVPNSPGWKNSFGIKSSSSNKIYVVAQRTTDGSFGCSCLGWITSGKRNNGVRNCKHLAAIRPILEATLVSKSIK